MPKITAKTKGRKLFAKRLKAIRSYVDFNYDLRDEPTAAAKRKVKRYYDEISKLENRPHQIYRPRSAAHLRKSQQFAQHEAGFPGIKVAFIPSDGGARGKIKWTSKGIEFKKKSITITDLEFDAQKMLTRGPGYINKMVTDDDTVRYTIKAGAFEIPHPHLGENLASNVFRLMAKYGGLGPLPEEYEDDTKHWKWWLTGAKMYETSGQEKDIEDYFNGKTAAIKAGKQARQRAYDKGRAARRRAQRKQS